ncbi:MAG: eukaryotic-like serine/threonine-protein kinase [Myxococcales bacterium]|jgi:serine/threonine-protein kinase|nr:eukaryotic-like serine/threonine-protein kinase [Myxococcales bacterium]
MQNLSSALATSDSSPNWSPPIPGFSTAVFAPDTVLDGTYRIVRSLAQGGMGEVYLAAHERLPGYFAVKALQAELAYHPESQTRFRREAEILAGIRHPNVVQVVDFNISTTGVPYLVLEYIDGPDLASDLRDGRRLAPIEVMSIVRQVASALAAAHAVGVVHRDLKPENIVMVPAPGQAPVVKVIDFGISISGVSPRITTDSRVMGTPEFMSPEQALGRREEIDARSDQFALAALTHTLLAGHPPFRGDTPLATLSAIVHGQPEPLVGQVQWLADEVQWVLRKGMARVRDDRYPTVLEFADALEGALGRSGALGDLTPTALAVRSGDCHTPATGHTPPTGHTPTDIVIGHALHPSGDMPAAFAPTASNDSVFLGEGAAGLSPSVAEPAFARDDEWLGDEMVPARNYSPRLLAGLVVLFFVVGALFAVRVTAPSDVERAMSTATTSVQSQWKQVAAGVDQWVSWTKTRFRR